MIEPTALVDGAFSFLALGLLIGLFFTAWQSFVVDEVRQRVFEIRDRSLLWAHDHGHLDDPGYREFREITNITIRHFENMTLAKIVFINKVFKLGKPGSGAGAGFMSDPHWSRQFHKIIAICGVGVILRSPFVLLVIPVLMAMAAKQGMSALRAVVMASAFSREIEADLLLAAETAN